MKLTQYLVRLKLDGLSRSHTAYDEVKKVIKKKDDEYGSEIEDDGKESIELNLDDLEESDRSINSDEEKKQGFEIKARTNKPDELLVKREATLLAIL